MRKLIYLTLFLITAFYNTSYCQHTVVTQSGVEIYFTRSYYNTVGYCYGGDRKFDQYYVTVYLLNASGRDIYLNFCQIDFGRVCLCTTSWKENYANTSSGVRLMNGEEASGSAYVLEYVGQVPSNPGYRWSWKFGKTPFD